VTTERQTPSWWEASVLDSTSWREPVSPLLERAAAACENKQLPASLLLVGAAGMGRELAAVELAAMAVCQNGSTPWCSCSCCARVRRGLHPDVVAVLGQGASGRIGIDQIRHLVESAPSRPFEGHCRVWILDGVEERRLTTEAANAFLKTLEEPPAHVRFLLLAANPQAVLATIRSRCQRLSLPNPVAVAHQLGTHQLPLELAAIAQTRPEVADELETVRSALGEALTGQLLEVLQLPHSLAETPDPFSLVAIGAVEEAAATDQARHQQALVSLASQALEVQARCAALNLNHQRQLLACLLAWYRDSVRS